MYPTSTVRLLTGVPLSNNYKNQLTFTNGSTQQSYFIGKTKYTISEMNYVREGGIVHVPYNYDELLDVNYIMFQNHRYSNKWFYAFVTRKEYVDPTSARIYFEIDVFQTWQFEIDFKPSFVEREHLPLSQIGSSSNPLHPNTIDEGLDYGTDMDTVSIENLQPRGNIRWLVIVAKNVMHGDNIGKAVGSIIGTPQPLSYYVIPFRDDESSVYISMGADGGLEAQNVPRVLDAMYKNETAVNNIVSLYVTDYTGLTFGLDTNVMSFTNTDSQILEIAQIEGEAVEGEPTFFNALYVKKARQFYDETLLFKSKYADITTHKETKLLQYPYVQLMLTDFRGNEFNIRPEYLNNNDNIEVKVRGSIGLSNKIQSGVVDYNITGSYHGLTEMLTGFINEDPQDVPIITDNLSAFLQGNRNSINNQTEQIGFNAVMNGLGSVMNIRSGGGVGALTDGLQSAGNSYYEIKGINAKQQDISNIPPSLTKQGSNTAFSFGNGLTGLFLIKKQIKPEYQERIFHFLNMYGYQVNTVKVPYLKSRSKWNYVKTRNAYITGNIPDDQLSILSNIFDSGVTLWHTTDVGNYGADNYV